MNNTSVFCSSSYVVFALFIALKFQSLRLVLKRFRFVCKTYVLTRSSFLSCARNNRRLISYFSDVSWWFPTQVFMMLCFSALCMILQTPAPPVTSPTRLENCVEWLFSASFVTETDSDSIKSLQIVNLVKSHWFSTDAVWLTESFCVLWSYAMPLLLIVRDLMVVCDLTDSVSVGQRWEDRADSGSVHGDSGSYPAGLLSEHGRRRDLAGRYLSQESP